MKIQALLKSKETKNAGWLIGGRIAQMILSLFVGLLTARYLGPSNYGLISYGSAFVTFFSTLCNLGLNSVIIKDFVDNPHEQGKAIGSALLMRFVSSLLSVFMMVGIASIADKDEPVTIAVVALCGVGSVFHIFETFNYWFQYNYQSKVTAMATLVAYVITSLYKMVLLILQKDVTWFAFATSVDYIVMAIFLLIAYRKYQGTKLEFSLSKSKALFNISRHYILSSLMVTIYGHTDKIMLKQMIDETEVGYYAIATTVCAMWNFIVAAIIDSLYPTILRLKNQDYVAYEKKNRQLYALVFYICSFVSLCFLFFGDLVVKVLYGESFLPASDILKVVTWYTVFSHLGVARNAWVVSEGMQKYLKVIYACAAVLNVILNLALIPIMGSVGAAIATLVTQIFTSFVLPLFIKGMRRNARLMLEAILLKNIK